MTYRELANEFGINSQYLSRLIELNMVKDSTTPMLRGYDGEELETIRRCCLFSMLGVPLTEYKKIADGELDFKGTLKGHVEAIASDETNNSKAAIVLQNIRRDNDSLESVDPEGYIQHVKELKAQGGIFYDVNTLKLMEKEKPEPKKKQSGGFRSKLFAAFSFNDDDEIEEEWDNKNKNGVDRLKEWEERARGGRSEGEKDKPSEPGSFNEKNGEAGVGSEYGTGAGQNEENVENFQESQQEDKQVDIQDNNQNIYKRNNQEYGQEDKPENYQGDDKDNSQEKGVYREVRNSSETGAGAYDDKWSPYTDRGFGASNMGTGNWHGWSPGYGSYSKPIGVRARINNGEKTCPHPIRRFAARTFDATMVSLIGSAVLRLAFRVNINISLTMVAYCEIIFWMFEMLIEPLLLTSIGTTPGKWIMGLKVRDMKTKQKLELKQAYIRSLKLAWHGFGLMIPIFTVFKRVMSFMRCRFNDTMPWDNGIDVELVDESQIRIALVIIGIVLLNVGDEVVSRQSLIPENRGEITREQFYSNVVELMEYTGYSGDIPDFVIEERNGYVKSVSLSYAADEPEKNRYDEMYLGFMAFAGATNGSDGIDLMMTSAVGRLKSYSSDFQDQYLDVTIINTSDSEIKDPNSYNMLFASLYGTEPVIPPFNQTFTMIKG